MNNFPKEFVDAFNHAMIYEVGAFWNPRDPDVIAGKYDTREQRRKVGYVNIPADRGGETKYGIAQNANQDVVVRDLDLASAMKIYYDKYWIKGACDKLPYPLAVLHFDGCVNHGVRQANRFLQRAVNVKDDGVIGDQTISTIKKIPTETIIRKISSLRTEFYQTIVKNNPSQQIFLNGWIRRINEVTNYAISKLKNG